MTGFSNGFFLGWSLIIAIGAQNAFVIRQGLQGRHVGPVVLFCSLSDALLIWAGVFGLGSFIEPFMTRYADLLFLAASLWLAGYGLSRLFASWKASSAMTTEAPQQLDLRGALLICAGLTFLHPHVWLDTVMLMGLFSLPYDGSEKLAYATGAALASFSFLPYWDLAPKPYPAFSKTRKNWRCLIALSAC